MWSHKDHRKWHKIFQLMKEKHFQPQILDPVKLSVMNDGEISMFSAKNKVKESVTKFMSLDSFTSP